MELETEDREGADVLVVDDDINFRRALCASLRRRGYRTLAAGSCEEGLSEARAFRPACATVDLRMPGGGLEFLRALQSERSDMKVVVLTGFGSIATAVEAVKLGAVQYLTKPATIDQVLDAFEGKGAEGEALEAKTLDEVEWLHLSSVLADCEGNVSEAARRLKMHRRTLQRKLQRTR